MATPIAHAGTDRPTAHTVARLEELPVGSLRMVRVEGRRLTLVRTSEGVFALDHACPHEGYGLTQGELRDDLLTCAWHNWKFRVSDGACVLGEEDVVSHRVDVVDGDVVVTLTTEDPAAAVPRLRASLRRGIERDYVGQISRDAVRLLRAGEAPGEIVWEAVAFGAPRAEFGIGHATAMAADCLAGADDYDGDARALPVVQAISGISETELRRPLRPAARPADTLGPDPGAAFRAAVEAEALDDAEGLLRRALLDGAGPDEMLAWFTDAVSDHHLAYGHLAIYTQKAFQLTERLGWDRADTVLPNLVPTLVYGTREDKLPYMRPFVRELANVPLGALADVPAAPAWDDGGVLLATLLGPDRRGVAEASARAVLDGAGVSGLLDAVTRAGSERLLRYDVEGEWDRADDFGWLDITHVLTYANAVRWLWARRPTPDVARLALWCAFLAHWSGRHEWHTRVGDAVAPPPRHGSGDELRRAVEDRRPDDAVALALGLGRPDAARALQDAALADRAGSFIVTAHLIKTARAAAEEAEAVGSNLPLAATARFMAAPRLERFVAGAVTRSIDLVAGRTTRD